MQKKKKSQESNIRKREILSGDPPLRPPRETHNMSVDEALKKADSCGVVVVDSNKTSSSMSPKTAGNATVVVVSEENLESRCRLLEGIDIDQVSNKIQKKKTSKTLERIFL